MASSRSSSTQSQTPPPTKKPKTGSSSSDPILFLYESLEHLIYEEYSQRDWSSSILERLRKESGRSAPNLFKIVKSTLMVLQNSASKKDRESTLLKNKIQTLESKIAKKNEALDAPAKIAAAQRANEVAIQSVKTESPLLTLDNISFVNPMGKYDLNLYPSAMVLSSKKGEQLHVLLGDIECVIRVESPTSKDEVVVLPLQHALAVGKTTHDAIALKFKPKDVVSVSVPKPSAKAEFKGRTAADLKTMSTSASSSASKSVSLLFGHMTGKSIDMANETVFRSLSASRTCIICHYKACHGILWPLKGGLLFGLKPLIWLPAPRIHQVDFIRSSRYFELVVCVRSAARTYNFEMIEIDEESALTRYCSLQKFGQRGGKEEALFNKATLPSSKKEAAAVDIDLDESSDDSDFIMETSTASSIPEDYDSEFDETDAEDDGNESGSGSDEETDQNSNDDNAEGDATENGLDAFAVVSGSDTDP